MQEQLPSIYNITKEQASAHTEKSMEELLILDTIHWKDTVDQLGIILKGHLFIESLMNQLLLLNLCNATVILNYKFASKLELIEALGFLGNSIIIQKLKIVNKIRNDFSHRLDKKISHDEISRLIEGLNIPYKDDINTLKDVIRHLCGYLQAYIDVIKNFPLILSISINKNFVRDDFYQVVIKDRLFIKAIQEFREKIDYFKT